MIQFAAGRVVALVIYGMLLLVLAMPSASAQDEQAERKQGQAIAVPLQDLDNDKDDEGEEDGNEVEAVAAQRVVIAGNRGIDPAKMAAAKRFQLSQAFQVEIDTLDRICKLAPEQKTKLKIAAKGASKKMTAEWTKSIGQIFVGGLNNGNAKKDNSDNSDEEAAVEIKDASEIDLQAGQFLNMESGNPFKSIAPQHNKAWTSLVDGILNSEQSKFWQEYRDKQNSDRRKSIVDSVCSALSVELSLTTEQSGQLRALIEPHLEKANFGTSNMYDFYAAYYFASKVSDQQLTSFLSPAQIQMFRLYLLPYAQVGQMMEAEELR